MKKQRWTPEDRQRFADRDRLRASNVPPKTDPGPDPDEWDDDWKELKS
jgi:hypothetical protein